MHYYVSLLKASASNTPIVLISQQSPADYHVTVIAELLFPPTAIPFLQTLGPGVDPIGLHFTLPLSKKHLIDILALTTPKPVEDPHDGGKPVHHTPFEKRPALSKGDPFELYTYYLPPPELKAVLKILQISNEDLKTAHWHPLGLSTHPETTHAGHKPSLTWTSPLLITHTDLSTQPPQVQETALLNLFNILAYLIADPQNTPLHPFERNLLAIQTALQNQYLEYLHQRDALKASSLSPQERKRAIGELKATRKRLTETLNDELQALLDQHLAPVLTLLPASPTTQILLIAIAHLTPLAFGHTPADEMETELTASSDSSATAAYRRGYRPS
jgi:hypothetical protein